MYSPSIPRIQEAEMQSDREPSVLTHRRTWIADQFAALLRNGSIPKDDECIQIVLDFYIVNGLFVIRKKSERSPIHAVCLSLHVSLPYGYIDDDGSVTRISFTTTHGGCSTTLPGKTS